MADSDRAERIMAHLNAQHQRELSLYLRHFAGVPAAAARRPRVVAMSHEHMVLRAQGAGKGEEEKDHVVPFEPPLASWDQVRGRVTEMDAAARRALGMGDVYLTRHRWPDRPFDAVLFCAVLFYFFCAATLPWVRPGSAPWTALSLLGRDVPAGYRWLVKVIFVPVIGIHATEAVLFERRRMQRHGVERWSGLWWRWMICVTIEGLTAWQRSDRVLASLRAQKAAKAG